MGPSQAAGSGKASGASVCSNPWAGGPVSGPCWPPVGTPGGGGPGDRSGAWRARRLRRGHYLQAVQEEVHAAAAEEHLAVVGRLIRDVPERAPGELHDLVTLQAGGRAGGRGGLSTARRDRRLLAPREGSPDKTWAPPGQTSPMRGSRKTPLTILSTSFF